MNNSNLLTIAAAGALIAIVGDGIMSKRQEKKSVETLVNSDKIDIPEAIIRKAVETAVAQKVDTTYATARGDVYRQIKSAIESECVKDISEKKKEVIADVSAKIAQTANRMSAEDISREIKAKTKDIILEKVKEEVKDRINGDDSIGLIKLFY